MTGINPKPNDPNTNPINTGWAKGVTPSRSKREIRVNQLSSRVSPQTPASPSLNVNAAPAENVKADVVGRKFIILGATRSEAFSQVLTAMEQDDSVTFQDVRDLIDEANSGDKDHFDKVIKEAYVTYVQSRKIDDKEKGKEVEVQPQSRTTPREKERKTNAKSSTDTFIESEIRRNVEAQTIDLARESRKTHEKKMAKKDEEIRERNKEASESNIQKIENEQIKRKKS